MLYNVFTTTFTDLRSKTNNNRHGDRDLEFSHLVTMKRQAESQRYMVHGQVDGVEAEINRRGGPRKLGDHVPGGGYLIDRRNL